MEPKSKFFNKFLPKYAKGAPLGKEKKVNPPLPINTTKDDALTTRSSERSYFYTFYNTPPIVYDFMEQLDKGEWDNLCIVFEEDYNKELLLMIKALTDILNATTLLNNQLKLKDIKDSRNYNPNSTTDKETKAKALIARGLPSIAAIWLLTETDFNVDVLLSLIEKYSSNKESLLKSLVVMYNLKEDRDTFVADIEDSFRSIRSNHS